MAGALTQRLGVNPSVTRHAYGLIDSTTATVNGGANLSLAYPSGIVVTDAFVLVVIGSDASGTESVTTPTGYTLLQSRVDGGGGLFVYGRAADGSESGNLSVAHNSPSGTTDQWRAALLRYGGCDATNPFVDPQVTGSSGSTTTFPSVTLSAAGQIKLDIVANTDGIHSAVTFGAPTGFSVDINFGSNRPTGSVFEKTYGSSGATGTDTGSKSTTGTWASIALGLKAA